MTIAEWGTRMLSRAVVRFEMKTRKEKKRKRKGGYRHRILQLLSTALRLAKVNKNYNAALPMHCQLHSL